jgi:hypothetical protein
MTAPALRVLARSYPITVSCNDSTEPTTLLLHWTEEDPAAVVLTMEDPWVTDADDKVVEWIIARALVLTACLPQFRGIEIGVGDAVVRHNGGTANILLRSPEGECVLSMRGEVLTDFLRGVAALMPFGSREESQIYAAQIDAESVALLGGAA